MSTTTSTHTTVSVPLGERLTAGLMLLGSFLLMSAAHWPGLIKVAGVLAVAFAIVCRWEWREPAETEARNHAAGLAAVAGTVLLAISWPLALPGERLVTVAVVAGLALAHSANVELVRWHVRRGGR